MIILRFWEVFKSSQNLPKIYSHKIANGRGKKFIAKNAPQLHGYGLGKQWWKTAIYHLEGAVKDFRAERKAGHLR